MSDHLPVLLGIRVAGMTPFFESIKVNIVGKRFYLGEKSKGQPRRNAEIVFTGGDKHVIPIRHRLEKLKTRTPVNTIELRRVQRIAYGPDHLKRPEMRLGFNDIVDGI